MIISIASGKGGTGKTLIATSFALSLLESIDEKLQLLDCDVEEPNAYIFMNPTFSKKETASVLVPEIDSEKCNLCGRCVKHCAFNALAKTGKEILIFPTLCHNCGVCRYICPQNAIKENPKPIGSIEIDDHRPGFTFIQGQLNVGEVHATPVISAVKKHIDHFSGITLIDSPPGTSCPMVDTVQESDFCLLVTEPTPFGLNDLELAVGVVEKLGISYGVIINRSDLGNRDVEDYCKTKQIPILMKIPFKAKIALAYSQGISLVEAIPEYKERFQILLQDIRHILSEKN